MPLKQVTTMLHRRLVRHRGDCMYELGRRILPVYKLILQWNHVECIIRMEATYYYYQFRPPSRFIVLAECVYNHLVGWRAQPLWERF